MDGDYSLADQARLLASLRGYSSLDEIAALGLADAYDEPPGMVPSSTVPPVDLTPRESATSGLDDQLDFDFAVGED